MKPSARLAVVFWETLAQAANRICALNEFPCVVRRFFLSDIEVDGTNLYFVVRQSPDEWDGLLFPIKNAHVLFLNEFRFEHTFTDEEQLEALLEAVRCAFRKGHIIFIFEKQDWKERRKNKDNGSNGHQWN